MFINIIMMVILIVAIIFFLGFIVQIIYLIITPAKQLTTVDCLRKNILYKFLKLK
jgi:hypothetical protein